MSIFADSTGVGGGVAINPAVIGTLYTVKTVDVAGDYVYSVNLKNMIAGDTTVLVVNTKITSTDTTDLYLTKSFSGVPTERVNTSIPFRVEHEATCTLQQTVGTGRTFSWSVWKID